jgi:hypothetical protein
MLKNLLKKRISINSKTLFLGLILLFGSMVFIKQFITCYYGYTIGDILNAMLFVVFVYFFCVINEK